MITSTRNPKIQWLKTLQASPHNRRQEGAFVIEGVRLLEEAVAAAVVPRFILHTPDLTERGLQLLGQFTAGDTEILEAAPNAFKAASDTKTPQGVLAVCDLPSFEISEPGDPTLILDHLRDPGNLGTILRTAAALGVEQVLLSPKSVDPFSPKALRAGMGAQFQLGVMPLTWNEIGSRLDAKINGQSIQVLLSEAGVGSPFTEIDFQLPTALIIGSEADGVSQEARESAHRSIQIPMPGGGESLNAAVAAGILLYEIARQRL